MKKIRVKHLEVITLGFLSLSFILILIFIALSRKLPWGLSALCLFSVFIFLSLVTGFVSHYDFKKKFGGELIDENQFLCWSNLFETRWMVFFLMQLIFIILNPLLMKFIAVPFVEGWSLGKDHNPTAIFRLLLTFSPTIIFIFGGFIWKINKSDEELIKLKRRDRIKTEDLEELLKKVDLEKWIENDPVLQKDKELFSKIITREALWITYFDDNLKSDKDFILSIPNLNYRMLEFYYSVPFINFEVSDLTNELMLKLLENSDSLLWGYSEFSKSFTKKIIDSYENLKDEDNLTPMPVVKAFFEIKNSLRRDGCERFYPSLASYKECKNNKHIIEKELEHCPYCK